MNKTDIVNKLKEFGLKTGDIVLVHSSLASIGHVEGGPDAVIDAFLETIGGEGTLVAPVFGNLGILTHTLKNRPEAIISDCPRGTVAAIGADAEFICRDHWKADTAHGHETPYLKIAGLGGYICLLGVDQDRNTTLHSVEALLELPYLGQSSATIETADGPVEKTWKYYPGPHRDFIGIDNVMRANGKMISGKIGSAVVRLMKSKDLIDTFVELGSSDPAFCLCDNENCADCVRQRAAIRKDQFAKEDFKIAVASSVAGRYIPEMVEKTKAAGIGYIELDVIEGKPAHKYPAEKLAKAVQEFSDNGIEVSALRLPALSLDFESSIELVKCAGIDTIIMPLSDNSAVFAAKANDAGISVNFANNAMNGTYAAEIMSKLKADNIQAGFAYSPAEFAKAGEMPFLQSFRQGKFRKYATQLDIEDALFDGSQAEWACGNAEIKELVSILRCASFKGFMTISSKNIGLGSPKELADKFFKLLAEI